ncbi:MAG: hypothetical protein GY741_14390, partial [Phycisphaeraceae bacterium]|nr:hypothetical protein [Phycisphaeraceae bacterium]
SVLPLAEVEREHIFHILDETDGNRTRASVILGITRQTLLNKLKIYDRSEAGDEEGMEDDSANVEAPSKK